MHRHLKPLLCWKTKYRDVSLISYLFLGNRNFVEYVFAPFLSCQGVMVCTANLWSWNFNSSAADSSQECSISWKESSSRKQTNFPGMFLQLWSQFTRENTFIIQLQMEKSLYLKRFRTLTVLKWIFAAAFSVPPPVPLSLSFITMFLTETPHSWFLQNLMDNNTQWLVENPKYSKTDFNRCLTWSTEHVEKRPSGVMFCLWSRFSNSIINMNNSEIVHVYEVWKTLSKSSKYKRDIKKSFKHAHLCWMLTLCRSLFTVHSTYQGWTSSAVQSQKIRRGLPGSHVGFGTWSLNTALRRQSKRHKQQWNFLLVPSGKCFLIG